MGSRFFCYKVFWEALRQEFDGSLSIRNIGIEDAAQCRAILARALARYRFVRDFADSELPPATAGCQNIWLTICPPDDQGFTSLRERIEKFLSFTKISRYFGVYEQRAEWPEPEHGIIPDASGFHSHILFEYTNTSQSMTRRIRNSFRGWNVDIKFCPDKYIQDKLHYMCGEKDVEKARKSRMDVFWRMQNRIPDSFSKDPWAILPGEPEHQSQDHMDDSPEVQAEEVSAS